MNIKKFEFQRAKTSLEVAAILKAVSENILTELTSHSNKQYLYMRKDRFQCHSTACIWKGALVEFAIQPEDELLY